MSDVATAIRVMTSCKLDVPTLLLLAVMYALLAGNAALYYTAPLHPLAHVAIGALAIHLAFTIWHEAVHGTIVAQPAHQRRRSACSGCCPYMTPFFLQRWLHLEHHRRLNQPDDPNHVYTDGLFVTLPFRYPRALAHARRLLPTDPRTKPQRRSDAATTALVVGVLAAALATGALARLPGALVRAGRGREAGDGLVHQLPPAPRARPGRLPRHAHHRGRLAHAARAEPQLPCGAPHLADRPVAPLPRDLPEQARRT